MSRSRGHGRAWPLRAGGKSTPRPLLRMSDGTFTRGSEASYPTGAGTLAWAAANVLRRFANLGDDVVGAYLAATNLLENSATNLLTRSEEFSAGVWTTANLTVAPDDTTAPDGDVDADGLVGTTAGSAASIQQTAVGSVGGSRYAFSVYLKRRNANQDASVSISDGVSTTTLNVTLTDAWRRVQVQLTSGVAAVTARVYAHADGASGILGQDGNGVDVWGAQVELVVPATITSAPAASSYIRTAATAVTRSADSLTFANAAVPAALLTGRAKFAVRLDWLASESTAARAIYSPSSSNVNRIRIAGTTGELNAIEQSVQRFAGPNLDAATRFEKSIVVVDLVAGRFEVDGVLGTAGTPFDFTAEGTTWRFGGAASTHLFGRISDIYAG